MNRSKTCRLISTALIIFWSTSAGGQGGGPDVVYVPTPQVVVEEMLRLANVGPKDYIIDLGSGDGRIVITAAKKFGAKALGVELDVSLLNLAREEAKKQGVAESVRFLRQDLFETDLRKATVISTYLLPEMNLKLRPKILSLKSGTRVVAHDYHMGDWYPDEQRELKVPEKQAGTAGVSYLYLWIVPEIVAGKWRTELSVAGKEQPYMIMFDQTFQMLQGTLSAGSEISALSGRVNGDQVSFTTQPTGSPGGQSHEFKGRISGGTITGTVRVGAGEAAREERWNAKR
jgi:hypothetical protein